MAQAYDSTTLHALQHHAKKLMPIASTLALGVATDLETTGWVKKHTLTHCYSIHKGNKEFHFRYRKGPWRIAVYDGFRGNHVTTLNDTLDVMRFIRKAKGM